MAENTSAPKHPPSAIPPDNPERSMAIAQPNTDKKTAHIGVVGDTYTILLAGNDTAGRFCLIDMHIPPGGGPPPHRHDFEETFTVLEGELDVAFRVAKHVVRAGETINIPANAPHQFHNSSSQPVRMLCICSPAGQEEFFLEIGVPVATRTTPPPKLDDAAQADFKAKVTALAPKYRTELLESI
jgi:quercetin dioxygenase-like cupin family protein